MNEILNMDKVLVSAYVTSVGIVFSHLSDSSMKVNSIIQNTWFGLLAWVYDNGEEKHFD